MHIRYRLAPFVVALGACIAPTFAPRFAIPAPVAHERALAPIDVEHYAIDIELEPATRRIRAVCTLRFLARERAVERVELDFADLTLESVRDELGRALAYSYGGAKLTIELAEPLPPGDSAELAIAYSGTPRRGLWFARERDGVATQVFTQGECVDSRGWFPCCDEPSERATSEVRVTLPPGWTSFAAGERVDARELPDGRQVDVWRMNTPHPAYLTTLVAGEFTTTNAVWDGTPLVYAAAPEYSAWLDATFASTPRVLAFLSDLTGVRYPYAKYSQACVANFPFGGMENISATTLTDACVRDDRGRLDDDPTALIAHEAAHQWFGDLLTCADWSHVWLNESFATYAQALYVEATAGTDAFRVAMRDTQDGYVAADVGAERRPMLSNFYVDPLDLFFGGGRTYAGGASRLHLLRFTVGDEAFFAGLKQYVRANAGRAVVTADFRRAMERASGLDLGLFFRQWFEHAGYPEFDVQWRWDPRKGVAVIEVEQVQEPLHGTPSVFAMPVEIEVRDASGARATRVMLDERHETFQLAAPTRPVWIVFDRNGWIPKRVSFERSTDEWLALVQGDDVNGRRDALAALGATLADSTDEALRWRIAEAILERFRDTNPDVRVAAARALARVYTPPDNPIAVGLMRAASNDPAAKVRVAALETLARWRENAAFTVFAREQYAAAFSWGTMGAAARVIAAAEGPAALPWFRAELERRTPHDALRAGLLDALARIPGVETDELLRHAALDAESDAAARQVAIRALARRAPQRPDISAEFAELLLSTRSWGLRTALIEALAQFGDLGALQTLERFYGRSVDSRHRRAIERALAK